MPIIINKATGHAEDVQDAQSALAAGSHELPIFSPDGQYGTAEAADAPQLLQSGYTQPTPEQLQHLLDKAKNSTLGAQLETGARGAADMLSFGVASGIAKGLGASPKTMRLQEEANPGSHLLGQALGLGVGMFGGATEVAANIGEMAVAKIGAETAAQRIGSAATKAAIENMLLSSGDEVAKSFAADPSQSAESAIANIGLSGVLGAALMGTGVGGMELWKAGPGKQLQSLMGAMKNRTGGIPAELKETAGITLSPEIEGALSDVPEAKKAFQVLQESNSSSGDKVRAAIDQFHQDIKGATATALGKTPEEIASLHEISEAEVGASIKNELTKTLKETVEPISKSYDKFAEEFKGAAINPADKANLATDIAHAGIELGLDKAPSSSGNKLFQRVLNELPLQETAQDLRNYARNLKNAAPYGSEDYQVAKQLASIIRGAQDQTITGAIGAKAPEMLEAYQQTQKQYGSLRTLLDTLNDRLHVGRYGGAQSFMENLASMAPEDVVRRLSTKGDSELVQLLNEQFPSVSAAVQKQELNKVLKASLDKTRETLDTKKLFKKLQELQPEQRAYLITPEAQTKLDAIHGLLQRVPDKLNHSGTARTLDALWNQMPASATAIASMLTGHNPVAGYLLGKAAHYIGKEAPDAMRLAMLKFLASDAPTSAAALKETVHLTENILKGEKALAEATKGIFEGAIDLNEPSSAELQKLKTQVDAAMASPDALMNVGGEANHYIPDHVAGMSAATARTVQYLTTLKPSEVPAGILDAPRKVAKSEDAEYDRALRIAENPLLVLQSVRDGSLTPKEIQHLQAMYPGLYAKMQSKVGEALLEHVHEGKPIKYKTQIATAMLLGQPLSSSMKPQNIQSAQQAMFMSNMGMRQQKQAPNSKAGLSKQPKAYMTPQQDRISDKMDK